MADPNFVLHPQLIIDQYALNQYAANLLSAGEETFPRFNQTSTAVAPTSGQLRLTYFTARKTEANTSSRMISGGTAAGATPTLCRWGVYQIAANGDGTLVASIANDTALFAATTTQYTKAWQATFNKVAGQRYAFGVLVVTAAAMPTFTGLSLNAPEAALAPRVTGLLSGQTDLPASFTEASLSNSGAATYGWTG